MRVLASGERLESVTGDLAAAAACFVPAAYDALIARRANLIRRKRPAPTAHAINESGEGNQQQMTATAFVMGFVMVGGGV